jgi:3-oxoacyl-[acyl-carrier protein] reductase
MRLGEKIVFLTEADSSAGRAIFRRLSAEGASFILNSASGGEAIRDELERSHASGRKAMIVNVDTCNRDDVDRMLETASRELGEVDILVHNNDLTEPGTVEHGGEDWFRRLIDYNAKSAFICTQAVGRRMAERHTGKIVFVSSIHAEKPTGSSFPYSASKGAVKMLTREAALRLGRSGVTVNAIEFGPVEGDDERFRSDLSLLYEHYRTKVPNAVPGTHDDLAEAVLFLASDESRFVNGADIRVDGGFLMHYLDGKMKRTAD